MLLLAQYNSDILEKMHKKPLNLTGKILGLYVKACVGTKYNGLASFLKLLDIYESEGRSEFNIPGC